MQFSCKHSNRFPQTLQNPLLLRMCHMHQPSESGIVIVCTAHTHKCQFHTVTNCTGKNIHMLWGWLIRAETCIAGKAASISCLRNSLLLLFSAPDTLTFSPTELCVSTSQKQLTSGMSPFHSFIHLVNKETSIVPGGGDTGARRDPSAREAHTACPTVWALELSVSYLLLCHRTAKVTAFWLSGSSLSWGLPLEAPSVPGSRFSPISAHFTTNTSWGGFFHLCLHQQDRALQGGDCVLCLGSPAGGGSSPPFRTLQRFQWQSPTVECAGLLAGLLIGYSWQCSCPSQVETGSWYAEEGPIHSLSTVLCAGGRLAPLASGLNARSIFQALEHLRMSSCHLGGQMYHPTHTL